MEYGGKREQGRDAAFAWCCSTASMFPSASAKSKAVSPLRFATALHKIGARKLERGKPHASIIK